ncbi:outer membrane protein [Candidatus Berkiella aquae]|uniref:Outer membrane protein A n=1 Tax=Candidatus Berkiella aquae TaxID=295108 RepID=A0A0Q9YVW6_9GAMM|nr:outer membrane beta-barrel protein [Candidatus Berkiella aquae]MCS5710451.1 porin family protein [Candidatus Berkiella aquae]
MKNNIKTNILGILVSSIIPTTYACIPEFMPETPYVSAQIEIAEKPYSDFEARKAQGRVAAGYQWGYDQDTKVGIEGGINFFENAHYTISNQAANDVGSVRRIGLDALAVLDVYVTPVVDFFAKAGPSATFQKFKYNHNGMTSENHKDGLAAKFVLGVGYDVTPNVNAYLAHEFQTSHRHDEMEHSRLPTNNTAIGIRYHFC